MAIVREFFIKFHAGKSLKVMTILRFLALATFGLSPMLAAVSNFVLLAAAQGQDARAVTVLEKARQHLVPIGSMEIDVTYLQRDPTRDGGELIEESAHMLFSNDMWRSEGVVGKSRQSFVAAFNGSRFQMIYDNVGDPKTLVLSNQAGFPNPAIQLPPVILPFGFAVDRSRPYTLGQLRDPNTWSELSLNARYLETRTFEGQVCNLLDIPQTMQGVNFNSRVWFAAELSEFPLKTEMFDSSGKKLGELIVSEHQQFTADDVSFVVPVQLEETTELPEGVWERTVTIDKSSMKLNQPVDEELFTIPTSLVDYVRDVDANTYVRIGAATAIRRDSDAQKLATGRFRFIAWLIGIPLISAIGAYIFWRRWR